MRASIRTRLHAWFLSTVVTRLVRQPAVSLTSRAVPEPEWVSVPTRFGAVRCLITRPAPGAPLAVPGPPPVVVNIHGGGFVIGNPRQDQHLARGIAGEVGAVVVNVDYSIAPRARFPRALEECFDVLQWVARSGPEMGWDASRIAMSGGSAGANLALGTIALARRSGGPAVRTAALIVPAVDQTVDPNVRTSPLDKPFVSPALMTTSYASYFTDPAERSDPLASPVLLGDELTGFPPLLVVTAGLDTFLPYIDAFTARARAHGVDVTSLEIEGVDHDFYFSGKTATPVLLDLMVLVRDQLLGHLR